MARTARGCGAGSNNWLLPRRRRSSGQKPQNPSADHCARGGRIDHGLRYNRRMVRSPSAADRFLVRSGEFEPAYLALYRSGELRQRAAQAVERLRHCLVCPRDCGVDRMANRTAACHTGRYAQISSYFPHFGEESCLRGRRGSGTIFFAMCNLRCVFCQNYDISQGKRAPKPRRSDWPR